MDATSLLILAGAAYLLLGKESTSVPVTVGPMPQPIYPAVPLTPATPAQVASQLAVQQGTLIPGTSVAASQHPTPVTTPTQDELISLAQSQDTSVAKQAIQDLSLLYPSGPLDLINVGLAENPSNPYQTAPVEVDIQRVMDSYNYYAPAAGLPAMVKVNVTGDGSKDGDVQVEYATGQIWNTNNSNFLFMVSAINSETIPKTGDSSMAIGTEDI